MEQELGTLTLDLEGTIIGSSGDLVDATDVAQKVIHLLQDVNVLLSVSGCADESLRQLSVVFGDHTFLISRDATHVSVVKQTTPSSSSF